MKKGVSRLKNVFGLQFATLNLITYVTEISYLVSNIRKLSSFELGHTYITLFMTSVVTSRIILVFLDKYHKIANNFLESLHLFHHQNKSEYAYEINSLVHKISHYFTIYLFAMMVAGCSLFNLMPLYANYSNGKFSSDRPENSTFEHSVYHNVPFDYTTDIKGYFVVFIFNLYTTFLAASSFCTHDLFLSLMVFHVWGHIKILIHYLDNFPRPVSKTVYEDGTETVTNIFTDEELKDVSTRMRIGIRYHNYIVNFASNMSNTFGEILLFYYAFHQVCGCFLLLECSQMDAQALLRYGTMSFVLFQQLIQISMIFELLGTSGERLEIAVYGLPWECMDTKNRKLVYFMLRRAQAPMNVKAVGMVSVGVQTMTTILRTSFSYFIMLRTLAEE